MCSSDVKGRVVVMGENIKALSFLSKKECKAYSKTQVNFEDPLALPFAYKIKALDEELRISNNSSLEKASKNEQDLSSRA